MENRSIVACKYLDLISTNNHSNASLRSKGFLLLLVSQCMWAQNFKALKLSYFSGIFRYNERVKKLLIKHHNGLLPQMFSSFVFSFQGHED